MVYKECYSTNTLKVRSSGFSIMADCNNNAWYKTLEANESEDEREKECLGNSLLMYRKKQKKKKWLRI